MNKARLTALVGAGCCGLLLSYVPQFEGVILRGYTDPIGIVTACVGHTKTAVLGRPYTKEECESLLVEDLVVHAEGVLRCTPILRNRPYQLAAATSFTFNIGLGNYCRSTTARRFNAGDFAGGCKAMNENDAGGQQWVYAEKTPGACKHPRTADCVVLPGLVTRRKTERALCEAS